MRFIKMKKLLISGVSLQSDISTPSNKVFNRSLNIGPSSLINLKKHILIILNIIYNNINIIIDYFTIIYNIFVSFKIIHNIMLLVHCYIVHCFNPTRRQITRELLTSIMCF